MYFLGAFTELWKVTISLVMSICLHGTTGYSVFLKDLSKKFRFHSKLTRIMGTLHEDTMCICDSISRLLHRLVVCCLTWIALNISPSVHCTPLGTLKNYSSTEYQCSLNLKQSEKRDIYVEV